uniref:Peptidase M16C associated domain-containing protein n=1 Tax=Rhizochromulina marina TaxID=1034831 RepID=A0A7S2WKA3_9STRA
MAFKKAGVDSWEVVASPVVDGVAVKLYRSAKTGMRVLKVDAEGPMVNLYGVLSTEAVTNAWSHKNDGLPHTLEHLVFLGSKDFPYKGILDKLANRCLAQGTNAWTATDHTAYTVTTAGSQGFLSILPIFVDHILRPTLTEEGFVTEIHHITGEGEDKGVVYCEMQGRENTGGSLVNMKLLELLYPDPACGYQSETGGMMKNLRVLTADQVRQYHAEYYRADNLCLVVTGKVEDMDLLRALKDCEQRPAASGPRPWAAPVQDLPPPAPGAVEVAFPSEDESTGMVAIGWRGPRFEEFDERTMDMLLWAYLTDSPASPLTHNLVESDDAVCAGIYPSFNVFKTGTQELWFDDVNAEVLGDVEAAFVQVLEAEVERGVDLDRMHDVIGLERRKFLSAVEDRPGDTVLDPVIYHFLYGDRSAGATGEAKELKDCLDFLATLERARTNVTAEQWTARLVRVLEADRVVVIGKPCATLAVEMPEQEAKRQRDQAQTLGSKKLAELAEVLRSADEKNNEPPPTDVLTSVPMPDAESVIQSLFPIVSIRAEAPNHAHRLLRQPREPALVPVAADLTGALARGREALGPASAVPFAAVQFDHVSSEFLRVECAFDTSQLSPESRLYLPLIDEVFFKQAVVDEQGQEVGHLDVVNALERDLVGYWSAIGYSGGSFVNGAFGQYFFLFFKVERGEIDVAIQWLRRMLWQVQIDPERLRVGAAKLLNEIPSEKRNGGGVAQAVVRERNFQPGCNISACAALRQQRFLQRTLRRIQANPQDVVQEVQACREAFLRAAGMVLHVAGDLTDATMADPWGTLTKGLLPPGTAAWPAALAAPPPPQPSDLHAKLCLNENGRQPRGEVFVVGLSAVDNCFMTRSAPGLAFDHPDLPALEVAIEYLSALEGPFWVEIRGKGLAYGSSLRNSAEAGLLYFGLYRSADCCAALDAATSIVSDFATGKRVLDSTEFENAKGSLISSYLESEGAKSSALRMAFSNFFRGVDADWNEQAIADVLKVSREDAAEAMRKHLLPLFGIATATTAVAVPRDKVIKVGAYFREKDPSGTLVNEVPEAELAALFPANSTEPPVTLKERLLSTVGTTKSFLSSLAGALADLTAVETSRQTTTWLLAGGLLMGAGLGVAALLFHRRRRGI